jgi:deoxyhypusine synthase
MSWGKIADTDNHLVCYCEATLALPIITHALHERMRGKKRNGTDLSRVFG